MRSTTLKILLSFAGAAVAVPYLVITLVAGAHAFALAQDPGDDVLVVLLALGGAAASVINGLGRRGISSARAAERSEAAKAVQRGVITTSTPVS